jgi:uncharacterized protein YdaU (DUF1376 family)
MLHESMTMDLRDFGAYCVVLDLIYQYGGAVPDDAYLISRYMRGCNAMGWKNVRNRLIASGHLYQDGDTLRSMRADAELKEAGRIREANAMGGHIAQAPQRKAKRLGPSDRPGHRSKLETKSAKNNDLDQVHSSYITSTSTDREKRREENGASAALESVGAFPVTSSDDQTSERAEISAKGSGEQDRTITVSPYLAQQIHGRWKQ